MHILGWNGNGNGAGCDICHIFLRINSLRELELTQYFVFELYNKAIGCIKARVDLDLASFTEDIWSH